MSVLFEDTATKEMARYDSSNNRSGEGLRKKDLLKMIRQALDVVNNGPTPNFRVDLYRDATGLVSTRSCEVKGMELMDGRLPKRHDKQCAVMGSGFISEFWRSDTGVDIGALSDSDSSEKWDYGRHDDSYAGFYGDNGSDSPRDLTACD